MDLKSKITAYQVCWMLLIGVLTLGGCGVSTLEEHANPIIVTFTSGSRSHDHRLDEFLFYLKCNYPEVSDPMDDEMLTSFFNAFKNDLILDNISRSYGTRIDADQVERFIKDHLSKRAIHELSEREQTVWRLEVKRRLSIRDLLQRKLLRSESASEVSEEVVSAFYEQNVARFKKEAQYRLRFMQTSSEDLANTFRKRLKQGKSTFVELAPEYAETKGYEFATVLTAEKLEDHFRQEVLKLTPGKFSQVIPVMQGDTAHFYVLSLESVIPEVLVSYEDAYHSIVEELHKRRCRDTLSKMLKDYQQSSRFNLRIHSENLPFAYRDEVEQKEVKS